jgi:hypothetical protein
VVEIYKMDKKSGLNKDLSYNIIGLSNEDDSIIITFIDYGFYFGLTPDALKLNTEEFDKKRFLENVTEAQPVFIDIYQVHGLSLLVGWGFLHMIGYCAARYLKHYQWWIYVHILCTELPALCTVITVSVIYSRSNIILIQADFL